MSVPQPGDLIFLDGCENNFGIVVSGEKYIMAVPSATVDYRYCDDEKCYKKAKFYTYLESTSTDCAIQDPDFSCNDGC